MDRGTLRKLLAEVAKDGKSARYPEELKEAAVKYFRARRAAAIEPWDIARELGMNTSTIVRWDTAATTTPPLPAPTMNEERSAPNVDDEAAGLDERATRFRANVIKAGIEPGHTYPEELRREALAYAEARKVEGATARAIADELGVSAEALSRWQTGKSWRRRAAFAPVTIESDKPRRPAGIVVYAGTMRIEGLDVDGVAELLRRLG